MSLTKKKLNIWAVVAALSFLYLAFIPYIMSPIETILISEGFGYIIRNFFSALFNISNILSFVANILLAVGILTKFDKIAVAGACAILWLSGVISLITNIANSIKYGYKLGFSYYFSSAFNLFTLFLLFAVTLVFAIFYFSKKPIPKLLKIALFIPVAFIGISFIFSFFTNTSNVISAIASGQELKWTIYSIVINSMNTINGLIRLVGFTAVAVKLADFKKKPENTIEINEEVVIENVTAE
ncbi:MAG: hypothetical protein J6B80_00570 [Clostridia bacterium]|nr:hypothetical protein [Clostridia bacterium]